MFVKAVEEKLLLSGQLLVPRGTHLRHTIGKTSIVIHWETVGHHLTSGSSNHGQLRLARIGGGVRSQRNVWQRGGCGCGLRLILRGTRQGRYRRGVGTLRSALREIISISAPQIDKGSGMSEWSWSEGRVTTQTYLERCSHLLQPGPAV